jgi:hypothetical protein
MFVKRYRGWFSKLLSLQVKKFYTSQNPQHLDFAGNINNAGQLIEVYEGALQPPTSLVKRGRNTPVPILARGYFPFVPRGGPGNHPRLFRPCFIPSYPLNRAADLPQGSSGSVGVLGKGADVGDSLKETFRSWKGFGRGAFAFGTGRFGFRVPAKYHHLKKVAAVPALVLNGRHFLKPL